MGYILKRTLNRVINLRVIFYLLIIYPVAGTASDINLAANPGFEIGVAAPVNWTFFPINENMPIWSNVSHNGSRSVEISIPGTTDLQSGYTESDIIYAQPHTTYTFSVWGKTQNVNGSTLPVVKLAELDENNSITGQADLFVFSPGTNDWEQKIVEFRTGSNTTSFYINVSIPNGYGNFWMDDVAISLKTNLAANPGFEIGITAPVNWTFFPINENMPKWSNVPHNGSRSLEISIPGTTDLQSGYAESDVIYVQPHTTYTFSVWGKTQNVNGSMLPEVKLAELDENNSVTGQADLFVFSPGSNDWEQKIVEFQTCTNTTAIYINASIPNGYGTFWMDDITLIPRNNLAANPGFEIGIAAPVNWTFFPINENMPKWSNVSHTGSRSVEISIPGTVDLQSGYPGSDVIYVQPQTTYTFSVWGKTQNVNGSNPPIVRIGELDTEMNLFGLVNLPFSAGTNDWEQRKIDIQTGSNTAYLYIYASIWNGYGTFWMDDVELNLKTTPAPTPPPPTSTPTPTPPPPASTPTPTPPPPTSTPTPTPPPPTSTPTPTPPPPTSTPTPTPPPPASTPTPTPPPPTSTPTPTPPPPTSTPTPTPPPPTSTPTPTPPPPPTGTTIAYLGDARPSKFGTQGITELTNDLNQVIPQSPTGRVDAIFMIGDMDKISQTRQAYAASDVKNIPVFYVVGNHEVGTSGDVSAIRDLFSTSKLPLSPGPQGTDKTTYSLNVGGIHIINTNIYWDGNNNGKCDWRSPGTTDSSDDACFKYSSGSGGNGGYIPDALYNWINSDLSMTPSWKIVVGHEPMYPKSRHVGDSLDEDASNRDRLQDLFESRKVSVYVAAHTHYAAVNNVGGVYHVDAGVSGQKTIDGEDPYASIIYTNTNSENGLVLTWKHENPTWSTPFTSTYNIKN